MIQYGASIVEQIYLQETSCSASILTCDFARSALAEVGAYLKIDSSYPYDFSHNWLSLNDFQ